MTRNEAIQYILNYAVEEIRLGAHCSERALAHRSATKYACYKLISLLKSNPNDSVFHLVEQFAKKTERTAEMIPINENRLSNYYMSTVAATAQDILDGLYIYDDTPLEEKIHGKS